MLHDMVPFDRKPACLVGLRLERSAEETLSLIRQKRKRDEKQKAVHKTDLRFHIIQRAPSREERGRRTKKSNLRLKTCTNFKEAGCESQWIFGSVSIIDFKVFD